MAACFLFCLEEGTGHSLFILNIKNGAIRKTGLAVCAAAA